jgi:hypothetical protein
MIIRILIRSYFYCKTTNSFQIYLVLVVVEITNTMHWFVPLLYSLYWLLHISAVACHHQGASWIRLSYLKYWSNRWYVIYSIYIYIYMKEWYKPVQCWLFILRLIMHGTDIKAFTATPRGSTTPGLGTLPAPHAEQQATASYPSTAQHSTSLGKLTSPSHVSNTAFLSSPA